MKDKEIPIFTILSIVVPVGILVFGVIVLANTDDRPEGFSFVSRSLADFIVMVLLAAGLSIFLAFLALVFCEKRAGISMIFALPSLFLMLWIWSGQLKSKSEKKQNAIRENQLEEAYEKIVSNPEVLHEWNWAEVEEPKLTALHRVFQNKEEVISVDDLRALYKKFPNLHPEIYKHSACPKDILEVGFAKYAMKRWSGITLEQPFKNILFHSNMPRSYAENVSQWEELPSRDRLDIRWTLRKIYNRERLEKLEKDQALQNLYFFKQLFDFVSSCI